MLKKQWILLFTAFSCAILGGVIFYYNNIVIPEVICTTELKVRQEIDETFMPKKKVAMIVGLDGISKYTEMTDEIISANVKLMEIPVKYLVQNAITDISVLHGKIPKEDLRYGQQLIIDSFSTDTKWFEDYERLKEYRISGTVAGSLKAGNLIDIIINYNNGSYDVVVPKIKVQRLIENDREKYEKQNNAELITYKGCTIILAVDEEQYRDLELAKQLGEFETRIYLDESQPASIKTFDGIWAAKKLNIER